MGTIKVTGNAQRRVSIDVSEYSMTITGSGKTEAEAMDRMLSETETLLLKLNEIGIKPDEIRIVEDNTYEAMRDGIIRARRRLKYSTKYNQSVGNAIIQVISDNKLSVEFRTDYIYSKESELYDELLKEAILDSKKKAEIIASASNQTIRRMVKARDDVPYYNRYDDFMKYELVECKCETIEPLRSDTLSASEKEYSKNVYVVWELD